MKLLILIGLLFIAVQSKKLAPHVIKMWEDIVAPYYDDCVKITNVDPEIPKTMFEQEDLPTAESFACYMKCIFEKLAMVDSNNELNQEAMLKTIYKLTPAEAEKCLKESASETNICKKIHDVSACIVHRVEND
ncbi:hypothetical protein RI129_004819 [Pyrocoelia pectoralis]|uniref:Uncharacterized protein n=1 Tax=Pyrocoelia pectoralis TaxID=417401 RepID=A0AAN7ZH31_9COLE